MEESIKTDKKRFRLSLYVTVILLIIMWTIHLLNISNNMALNRFGTEPREWSGLLGILTSPLLHGDWQHLIANSMSFIVLATGLFYFYPKVGYRVFAISWIVSGIIVWLIARPSYHIGASGLIYAMAGFLFLSGILRKDFRLMAVSLIIVFMYGSMIWGIFPGKEGVSWESHFAGLFTGFGLAWIYRKRGPKRKVWSWEKESEDEKDSQTPEDQQSDKGFYSSHTHMMEDVEIHYPADEENKDDEDKPPSS